ncbi:hypothetical protein E2C01_064459 [Portunus trituberculatus]|uniref:Uncharacterized protein n=1 Tax=Portunus trituberculatus TaxID=210409 RepID=A0A5B7HLV3_PORTR|nr:hypothetical protein [Portunus trituberculatus]
MCKQCPRVVETTRHWTASPKQRNTGMYEIGIRLVNVPFCSGRGVIVIASGITLDLHLTSICIHFTLAKLFGVKVAAAPSRSAALHAQSPLPLRRATFAAVPIVTDASPAA